jgi:hypothetical protein
MMCLILGVTFFSGIMFHAHLGLERLRTFEDHVDLEEGCIVGKDSVSARGQSECSDAAIYGPPDPDPHILRHTAPPLSIEDLIIDWRNLRSGTIAVAASIKCDNEYYCFFVTPVGLRATVQVDIENLSLERRRHIILECRSIPCEVYVTGTVDGQDFMAEEVLNNAL